MANFKIQKYYQNEPRFKGLYSWDNLPKKIKDESYVMNLDEYADVGTHWIVTHSYYDAIIVALINPIHNLFLSKEPFKFFKVITFKSRSSP